MSIQETYKLNEIAHMVITAGRTAFSTPQDDLTEINDYTAVQIEFYENGEKVKAKDININTLEKYIYNDIFTELVYANVPLPLALNVYEDYIKEHDKKHEVKPKKSNHKRRKRKLTKKQSQKVVNDIIKSLNDVAYELEEEIHSIMLALISNQHVLLIGKPGEGKSYLSKLLSEVIDDSYYYAYLLREDTIIDDLFGGMDTKEYMETGKIIRTAKGMVQDAHIVLFDEVFKANSGVLNGMLNLINEREFDNNGMKQKVPLITAIGASNEFPDDDANLEAFYDRFIIKHWIDRANDYDTFEKIALSVNQKQQDNIKTMSLDELYTIHEYVNGVELTKPIIQKVYELIMKLREEGISDVSTRTYQRSLTLLKAQAFINGRDIVTLEDLIILKHVYWSDIEDKKDVERLVIEQSLDKNRRDFIELQKQYQSIVDNFHDKKTGSENLKAIDTGRNLKELAIEAERLQDKIDKDDKELIEEINH